MISLFRGIGLWASLGATAYAIMGAVSYAGAGASRDAMNVLLRQRSRPTMQQVVEAVGPYPSDIPFKREYETYLNRRPDKNREFEVLWAELEKNFPAVLAFLEKAYPDAVWAPLGRDSAILGDVLSAFYLSIGQAGRVSPLNASGDSLFSTQNLYVRFLETAGLDLSVPQVGLERRPFVGLDYTSYNSTSQSTKLLSAAYAEYKRRGGDPEDLLRKFNFVGLAYPGERSSWGAGARTYEDISTDQAAIDSYFSRVTVESGRPSSILYAPIGNWTHGILWHDTFERLKLLEDGRVTAEPGGNFPFEDRAVSLVNMVKTLQIVSSPRFLSNVQEAAAKLNFSFSTARSSCSAAFDYDEEW